MVKPLKVYKASAGSGKTFTLAVEYIKLLVNNPDEYKFTLAVTFTNKATGEMKNRILSTLYGLSNNLTESDDYLEAIKRDENIKSLKLTDEEIRKRCGTALYKIIHDYSRFRIETIDSFFMSIIRDLTRELDLTANLRVDLNEEEVLEMAVDEIIGDLNKKDDLFKTVLRFVQEKIENGSNWKINNEVSSFGKNIFKEDFLRNREKITNSIKDTKSIWEYKKKLTEYRDVALDELQKYAEAFNSTMNDVGVSYSDIKHGSDWVARYINKLSNKILEEPSATIKKYADDPSTMYGAKAKQELKVALVPVSQALDIIINKVLPKIIKIVNSVNAITKYLNQMMLLNAINEKVRELNEEANRFLIADSAHFLNEIIDHSDIPFIYEKAGTYFKHIMIDEFQDTSALQWDNFKPLITNSMSKSDSCLIVGDVKQSIYRWRDSDWQILNSKINSEFKNYIETETLNTNYRSAGRIIHFNNQFFNKAKDIVNEEYRLVHNTDSQDLIKAYSDLRQLVPEWKEDLGFVYIENVIDPDYANQTSKRILNTVKNLHDEGIEWNDMTILVRENKHIPVLCQYFHDHRDEIDTKIVSDEAFRLDSSSAVNLIILAIQAISKPYDKFALRNFAIHFQMAQQKDETIKNDANRYFLADDEEIMSLLPKEFIENIDKSAFTPLYELIEGLYNTLSLKNIKGQDAYLFYFHDLLGKYVQDNQTDIESFLTYWEETMCSKTIPNGASDGIRIMSIHKSKGLEFHTVIVPYCDWTTTIKNDTMLWCETNSEPYNQIEIVPVNCKKDLDKSIFQTPYRDEVLKNNVDNLNLIYVAFTRASKNLIVLTGSSKDGKKSEGLTNIQQILVRSMNSLISQDSTDNYLEEPIVIQKDEVTEENKTIWHYGNPVPSKDKDDKLTDNVLNQKYLDINTEFVHEDSHIEFRQSNDSENLILSNDEENNADYIERGTIYHKIFELIKTEKDIDNVINELDGKGYFDSVFDVETARNNIKKAINNPIAKLWFTDGWREFKECNIMYRNKKGILEESRPDRVIVNNEETIVIDYKSGKENRLYSKQVLLYMNLLKRMGHKNIKGYVWYFLNDKVEEVKMEGGTK